MFSYSHATGHPKMIPLFTCSNVFEYFLSRPVVRCSYDRQVGLNWAITYECQYELTRQEDFSFLQQTIDQMIPGLGAL